MTTSLSVRPPAFSRHVEARNGKARANRPSAFPGSTSPAGDFRTSSQSALGPKGQPKGQRLSDPRPPQVGSALDAGVLRPGPYRRCPVWYSRCGSDLQFWQRPKPQFPVRLPALMQWKSRRKSRRGLTIPRFETAPTFSDRPHPWRIPTNSRFLRCLRMDSYLDQSRDPLKPGSARQRPRGEDGRPEGARPQAPPVPHLPAPGTGGGDGNEPGGG